MGKTKNAMIHEIKEKIGKHYTFPIGTLMELDYYEDYIPTALMYLDVKNNALYLTSNTLQYGVDTDKLSDFHSDYVKDIYEIVVNENK